MSANDYMEQNPDDYVDGFSAQRRCYAEFGSEIEDAESWRICIFERKGLTIIIAYKLDSIIKEV